MTNHTNYKVPPPFTSKVDLDSYLNLDPRVCLLCGKALHTFGTHLKLLHNISPRDYKRHFNIPVSTPLTSPTAHKVFSRATKKKQTEGKLDLIENARKMRQARSSTQPLTPRTPRTNRTTTWKDEDAERVIRVMSEKQAPIKTVLGEMSYETFCRILRRNKNLIPMYHSAIAALPYSVQAKMCQLSPQFTQDCLKKQQEGLSIQDIADLYQVSTAVVRLKIKGHNP